VWPLRTKLTGLVISAFLTGMAGALLGRYLSVVDPFDFLSVQVSSTILLVTFIGGLATVAGPLVGAALIIPAEQWLQLEFGSVSSNLVFQIGLGCFLILVAILLPQGVWGGAVDLGSSLRRGQRRLRGDGAGVSGEPEVSEEAVK
jgi:branched-chain amino acid transport system permease protein